MTSKGASASSQDLYHPTDSGPSRRVPDSDDQPHIGTPPPYTGPSSPSTSQPSRSLSYPTLPRLNYALYLPPNFEMSPNQITITTNKPEPSIYPAVLMSIIKSQSALPPKPQIHVKGKGSGATLDFHLKLNMMSLLIGDKDPEQRWNYLKVVDDGEMAWRGKTKMTTEPKLNGGIDEWVQRYCSDSSAIKEFTIQRSVSNWDTAYLEGRLHSLIASTGYRGQVEISFPLTHAQVVIHSPDRVNRLFTSMTHLFTGTKKYAVVQVVWPYASVPPDADAGDRSFAVQSEESWWNDWKDAIRFAVLTKRKGWVTVEDQLQLLMGGPVQPPPERGAVRA